MDLEGLTIWLDSGDLTINESMAELLVGSGCVVRMASSNTENIEKQHCDIQIVDIESYRDAMRGQIVNSRSELTTVLMGSMAQKSRMTEALMYGAEDFLITPIDPGELRARLGLISRRLSEHKSITKPKYQLSVFDHALDAETSTLTNRNGTNITLSKMELLVLWALAKRPSRILSRGQIIDFSYDGGNAVTDRMVDYHICKIRNKLKLNNVPINIKTRRGQGYLLQDCRLTQ